MAYTDVQKAMAVEIVRRSGGRFDSETLSTVRDALDAPNLSVSTIYGWVKSEKPETVTETRTIKKESVQEAVAQALDVKLEAAAHRFVDRAVAVADEANAKEAMTAAAIAIDKMRLLRNLPTEIVAVLPNLLDAIDRKGLKASEVFGAMLEELTRADSD